MSNNNWAENFIKDIPKKSDEYFLMVVRTSRSIAPILYQIKDGMAEHSNDLNDEIFDKYIQYWENNKETGFDQRLATDGSLKFLITTESCLMRSCAILF